MFSISELTFNQEKCDKYVHKIFLVQPGQISFIFSLFYIFTLLYFHSFIFSLFYIFTLLYFFSFIFCNSVLVYAGVCSVYAGVFSLFGECTFANQIETKKCETNL